VFQKKVHEKEKKIEQIYGFHGGGELFKFVNNPKNQIYEEVRTADPERSSRIY
jgi:hypothetical protein